MREARPVRTAIGVLALALLALGASCTSDSRAGDDHDQDKPAEDRAPDEQHDDEQHDDEQQNDDGSTRGDDDGGDPDGLEAATPPGPVPSVDPLVSCPAPTVDVADADALHAALAAASPGDVIGLAPGTYRGKFVATADATAESPIFLCGDRDAVIDGEGIKGGYAFHLDGVIAWRLVGFTVRNAQKGVVADRTTDTVIQGLLVEDIGDEAIHLRSFSTDNVVVANEIRDTGQRRAKFGEGVYVGTAESNWCKHSDCDPDRSDRNEVIGNLIYGTTSESVDLKEGTTGGVVRGNVFGGDSLSGADSWVDAKGNDWVIEGNVGVGSPQDGFQMHEILDGWGAGNVFRDNTATLRGPGYGFATTNTEGNVISCDNVVSDAKAGFADVDCTG